jgi:hypothetical protein
MSRRRLIASLHRRVVDAGYEAPPWDRLDPSVLPADEVAALRVEWEVRAAAEHRSMIVFGELGARFPELGLPIEATGALTKLVQDEARHTELCTRVAEALGGSASLSRERVPDDGLPAHLFVARWTASMFLVGETASVGTLRALAEAATDPCVRAVLETLHRDEVLHHRFGWALAELVIAGLAPEEREWLAHDLEPSIAHYERTNGGGAPDEEPAPGPNLGTLPRGRVATIFRARMADVIRPGLDALLRT